MKRDYSAPVKVKFYPDSSATVINRCDFRTSEHYEQAVITTIRHFDPFQSWTPCFISAGVLTPLPTVKTQHKPDCKRAFARYDLTCPRCQELAAGSKPREWRGSFRKRFERQSIAAIRNHDCSKSHCGPVCTFGDW